MRYPAKMLRCTVYALHNLRMPANEYLEASQNINVTCYQLTVSDSVQPIPNNPISARLHVNSSLTP